MKLRPVQRVRSLLSRRPQPDRPWEQHAPGSKEKWQSVRNPALGASTEKWKTRLLFGVLVLSLPLSVGACAVSMLGFAFGSSAAEPTAGVLPGWRPDPAATRNADFAVAGWVEQANGNLSTDWEVVGGGAAQQSPVIGAQYHDFALADYQRSEEVHLLRVVATSSGAVAQGLLDRLSGDPQQELTSVPCASGSAVLPEAAVEPFDQFVRAYLSGDQATMRRLAVAEAPAGAEEWPTYWQLAAGTPVEVRTQAARGEGTTPDGVLSAGYEAVCWSPATDDRRWGVLTVRLLLRPVHLNGWVPDMALLDVRVVVDAEPVRVYGASTVGDGGVG